jgi:hypothetical protein
MICDGDIIEVDGYRFMVGIDHDQDMGAPWDEHDGHGPVSEWTSRDKRPGEVKVNSERGSYRYYDLAEANRIAKRDGWGLAEKDKAELAKQLGREPTRGEIRAAAVRKDLDYIEGWCNDSWQWQWVRVVLVVGEDDEEDTSFEDSLGGIDGSDDDYIEECARDMIDGLVRQLQKRDRDEAAADRADRIRDATRAVSRLYS